MSSSGGLSSPVWKTVCVISFLSLLHCAYSAAQHRAYLRLTRMSFTSLPPDLIIQTLVSLLLTILSATFFAGEFQQIRADLQGTKRSWDTAGSCPSFYVFNHRAKCLAPKFEEADD